MLQAQLQVCWQAVGGANGYHLTLHKGDDVVAPSEKAGAIEKCCPKKIPSVTMAQAEPIVDGLRAGTVDQWQDKLSIGRDGRPKFDVAGHATATLLKLARSKGRVTAHCRTLLPRCTDATFLEPHTRQFVRQLQIRWLRHVTLELVARVSAGRKKRIKVDDLGHGGCNLLPF